MSSHPQQRPVRLAFVGTGDWARQYHLPALDHIRTHRLGGRELVLHGIYGPQQDEAAELAKRYGFARTYAALEGLVSDPEVDTVAVVITPGAVREVMTPILARGVPVFTEKPPGTTHAEAADLARLAGATRVANVVGFNRRYGLLNNRFRDLVRQLPDPITVRGSMYRRNRTEPDFVRSTGSHLVNFMEYLFGPIDGVRTERRREPSTGGAVWSAQVRFASGVGGEIVFSPCSDRHWEGVEVRAADRTLVLHCPHNDAPGEILVRPGGDDGSGGDEQVLARSDNAVPILEEGYVWEHVDLLAASADGKSTRSNFQNAVNTMRVAEAIEAGRDLA